MSETVVITGASGSLGRRVVAMAAAAADVDRVIAVDPDVLVADLPSGVEVHALEPDHPDVKGLFAVADVVVHLGSPLTVAPDGLPAGRSPLGELMVTRAVLDVAAAAGVAHVVMLSSAMVYGAWGNNPVPLTEDAPLRPDPNLAYAVARAQTERLAFEWRTTQPGRTVAVLRPAVTVAAESAEWLAASPWSAASLRASGTDRPSQFLHLDDLASALDHARRHRLDGPFNVASDGWLPADSLRDLAGPVGRLHLPPGLTRRVVSLRSDMGTSGPPEGWSYTQHPWVVANDRLRATGWDARHRNEEVYIETDTGGPLASMSSKRRQELSLVAAAGLVAVGLGSLVWAIRRRHQRSSASS
jgi:nucleoside-diphosphate-sugar epimerase